MTITPEIKDELTSIVQQAMEQRERKQATDKTVYRRICADFEQELHAFDYSKPAQYTDSKGIQNQYEDEIPCNWRIQEAVCTLLRIVYQVDTRAKLPSEKEPEMRRFMFAVLELMTQLKSEQ